MCPSRFLALILAPHTPHVTHPSHRIIQPYETSFGEQQEYWMVCFDSKGQDYRDSRRWLAYHLKVQLNFSKVIRKEEEVKYRSKIITEDELDILRKVGT